MEFLSKFSYRGLSNEKWGVSYSKVFPVFYRYKHRFRNVFLISPLLKSIANTYFCMVLGTEPFYTLIQYANYLWNT